MQFTFDLIDRMSGPAKAANQQLERLEKELGATEKALRDLNRTAKQTRLTQLAGTDITKQQRAATAATMRQIQADRLRLGISRDVVRSELEGVRKVDHERKLATDRALRLSENARSTLNSIGTGAVAAAAGVAALGVQFLRAAGHMSDLRAITMNFLTTQMGAREAADQMRRLEQFSTRYGISLEEASTSYHRMVAQGFNSNESMAIMQGGADVSTVMGHDVWEQLSRDLAILKQEGRVDTRHLRALSFAGVGIGDVTSEIAMARNRTAPGGHGTLTGQQIMEMVKHREITGDETISAALRVIQQRFSGGPDARLGTRAAEQATHTLGGSINRLDAQWNVFLSHVGESGAFQPVMRFMDRIGVALEGATVQGSAFNASLKPLLDKFDQIDIAKIITSATAALPGFIGLISDSASAIFKIVEGIERVNDLIHGRSQAGVEGISMSEDQRGVGMAPVVQQTWQQKAFNFLTGPSLGSQFLSWLRADNARMTAEANVTGSNMAGAIEAGFRDRAQIHSPSKVFTRLGMQMIEGLALGMNLRLDEVENASQAVMATMDRDVGGMSIQNVGGGSVSIGDVNVSVDGSNADADEIGRQIKRHLASLLTEVSGSRGAAT